MNTKFIYDIPTKVYFGKGDKKILGFKPLAQNDIETIFRMCL